MVLKMIAAQVLIEHGMYEKAALKYAGEIEDAYLAETSKMFVDRGKVERTISLDPEFLIESDSLPQESTHKEPADVSSTSAGLFLDSARNDG